MYLRRLDVDGLRCLRSVSLTPSPGLNVLIGANGAGKTSVLEALYVLGAGKSFRSGGSEALLGRGAAALQAYGECVSQQSIVRLGFERTRSGWRGLLNGERVSELAALALAVPVVWFSPESHELVSGPSEVRRRFFDWIVFHVEPRFAEAHRRYARLLRQRNQLLKRGHHDAELRVWTTQLAASGDALEALRARVFPSFQQAMCNTLRELLPELGEPQVAWRRGWCTELSLAERLAMLVERELAAGHTLAGPHRADWLVSFDRHPIREQGSRGQQKLVALAAVFVAARLYRQWRAEAPIIALDDLGSELDTEHQRRTVLHCAEIGAQVWVTGTQDLACLEAWPGPRARFHVEQGRVRAA
jgi:DNA replication and repair protein RecF